MLRGLCCLVGCISELVVIDVVTGHLLFHQWAVANLYRECSSRDLNHGCSAKVLGETLWVDGGRGNDEFEIWPLGQDLFEITQQEVNVEAAFVCLIDDDGVVVFQKSVALESIEQDTVGHDFDLGFWARLISEAHLVANKATEFYLELFGNTFCYCPGCDTPGLGVSNAGAAQFQAHLGYLSGLTGACSTGNNHNLVVTDGLKNLVTSLNDR